MEEITLTEFNKAESLAATRPMSPIAEKMLKLKVGNGLKISKDEWYQLTPPSIALAKIAIRRGIRLGTKTLADNSGWLIVRIK